MCDKGGVKNGPTLMSVPATKFKRCVINMLMIIPMHYSFFLIALRLKRL